MTRRDDILAAVSALVEGLPLGAIEDALRSGEITRSSIVAEFENSLIRELQARWHTAR